MIRRIIHSGIGRETGRNIDDQIAVTKGLHQGDEVICEGQQKVSNGVEVKKEKTKSYSRNGLCIIQIELNDDFGDSSAMLITMESKDKTYRELQEYMDDLQAQLQTIESVGRMTVTTIRPSWSGEPSTWWTMWSRPSSIATLVAWSFA